ncbi:MAG: hypothetical protein H7Y15_12980 [Pseudonocardia sp.]|nr:hypothetical protein [Pseudonocardia sp.]
MKEPSRQRRVLVIGLSATTNEEVVASLRDLGIDAVGCTEPDSAAEVFDACQFGVIAFGRGALGPRVDRLKRAFSQQDPSVRFVDAFGPIAVAQVVAALHRGPGSPVFVDNLTVAPDGPGARVRARVLIACHLTVTVYRRPDQGAMEERCLHDAGVTAGPVTYPVAGADLYQAYSLVAVANREEFHHLPFL